MRTRNIRERLAVNFFTAIAASACICMWGCSKDRVSWNEGFLGAQVVGFVDDSLVMVGSHQQRTESHEGLFEPYWDVIESGHERLCVYNYRVQEDGPKWCDTLDEYNMTNAFRGQMTDSIVWGGDMPNSIRLWKVGETQHQIKLKTSRENCSDEFRVVSVKQWLDGKFIARGEESLTAESDSCQYAVLDTVARMLTYKRLDKDLEWIKTCNDVRAWGDDVYCLALWKEPVNLYLLKDNEYLDSLVYGDSYKWNKYTKIGFAGSVLNLGGNIGRYKNGRIEIFSSADLTGLMFRNVGGSLITY